jgi:hypothetical protein
MACKGTAFFTHMWNTRKACDFIVPAYRLPSVCTSWVPSLCPYMPDILRYFHFLTFICYFIDIWYYRLPIPIFTNATRLGTKVVYNNKVQVYILK